MTNKFCIISGQLITPENNSRAHIIPSALGGRLKPWNIVSRDANCELGDKVDLPLIQAFQALMTLLNGSRDRGENQPVRMTDVNGRAYLLEFGEPLKLAAFNYEEHPKADGTHVHVDARNLKELRTLLGKTKAQHPEFDIDEAIKHAVQTRNWPDGMLQGKLQIGPRSVFPAVFTSASIFAVAHGHAPHSELKDYIQRFDPTNPEMPPDTFYFIPSETWVSAPGDVTHIVVLLANTKRKEMLIYMELFNIACVAVRFPYDGVDDVQVSYGVNIVTGEKADVQIDRTEILGVQWQATHKLGDTSLYHFTKNRIDRLLAVAQERAWVAEMDALIERTIGKDESRTLNHVDIAKALSEIVDFVLHQWARPLSTVNQMRTDISSFDLLCAQFENSFAISTRSSFRVLVAPHREKLTAALNKWQAT